MRPSKEQYFLNIAKVVATRATCLRRQVGCVITNSKGHIISTGYNGVATGLPHCNHFEPENGYALAAYNAPIKTIELAIYPHACIGVTMPSGQGLDSCEAIHAEANALLQCKDVHDIDTVYVTTKPCVSCMKLFMNTSCKRIVYLEDYPHSKSDELALKANIKLEKFNADIIS